MVSFFWLYMVSGHPDPWFTLCQVKKETRRGYRLKERAQQQAETRRRIVEAVVALHEEVGPARTTVVEIADRAQVSRPTVYTHFPDERLLMTACSQHWLLANPRPDTAAWKQIADPRTRVRVALEQLYSYYAPRERMLSNVLRDSELIPSLSEALQNTIGSYLQGAAETLAKGWDNRQRARREKLAVLKLALHFHTWQTLTGSGGLTNGEAAELMARLVAESLG
ncbi:MAG: TetR/AcrR family transcriptional regulator [Actinobacteria bacterium]|nr:MAG: TetR/AcrR family transcriptional regulator [Actinomycetota bacterium]TML80642.1 MAG: TetR/AcrR family transcriptional regulator [Actinomycetota bacterium]